MKIGLILPISWEPLSEYLPETDKLPRPLEFFFGAQLAAELRRRGHEIHIFTICGTYKGELHVQGDGVWVHICGYQHGIIRRMLTGFSAERDILKRMMMKYPCDIFHAHWCYEFARPVVESHFPYLVTMHDNPWRVLLLFRPKSYRFCRLLFSYYVLSRTKHISAVSPYMASYCERVHNMRDVKIIPNALALPTSIEEAAASRSGRSANVKVVFVEMANGWLGCKNIKRLLRAFALLRKRTSVVCELHIYGGGNEPDGEAFHWARKHGVSLEGVVLHGQVLHDVMLKKISETADVFVHASLEESFGLAIMEAMALGLPTIVGKDSGAASWVAGEGRTGFVIDVRQIDAIAQAMKSMAENRAQRAHFGAAALAEFKSRFSLPTVVEQYENLYKEIVNEP